MLKKIFESTLIMGASSVVVLLVDIVRSKVLAVFLGPTGMGSLSVLNQFHTLAVSLIGLGLSAGLVKYVAVYNSEGNIQSVRSMLVTSFRAILGCAFVVCALTLILRVPMAKWLLDDPGQASFLAVYAVALPLAAYPLVAGSLLQGLQRITTLARISVGRSLLSLALIVPLVLAYRLEGAVYGVLVTTGVHLLLCYRVLRREAESYRVFQPQGGDRGVVKTLLPYGATSLTIGAIYCVSLLLIKVIIVQRLGLEMNGIFQPVFALTMAYPTLVLSAMSTYAYPRLCELSGADRITAELNGNLRVVLLLIVPIMFVMLLAREPIVVFLYSARFREAADYLPVQIISDFFKTLNWVFGLFLLPTGRLRAFLWLNATIDILVVLLSLIWIDRFGLHAVTASFAASYALAFVANYFYARRQIAFRLWKDNVRLVAVSFLSLAGVAGMTVFYPTGSMLAASTLLVAGWSVICIKRSELAQLKAYLIQKLGRQPSAYTR